MLVKFYQISRICMKSLQIAIYMNFLQIVCNSMFFTNSYIESLQIAICMNFMQIAICKSKRFLKRYLLHKSLEFILAPKRDHGGIRISVLMWCGLAPPATATTTSQHTNLNTKINTLPPTPSYAATSNDDLRPHHRLLCR